MSEQIEITFNWEVNGALTDATSVKLSDSTGTYGIKRTDTGAMVIADGTDMVNIGTGMYRYRFTPTVRGLTYFFYIEIVYGGKTHRIAGVQYDPLPSTLDIDDFLAGVRSAFNRPALTTANITEALTNALQHMSDGGILIEWVATGNLVADQEYILGPVEYMGMGALTVYDSASNEQEPLKPIIGGFKEFKIARANDTSTGLPEYYTCHYANFYLYQMPSTAYAYKLHYYRGHPSYDDTIYYPARFKPLIAVGVKYYYAMDIGNNKYIQRWGPLFYERLAAVKKSIVYEPSIVGG